MGGTLEVFWGVKRKQQSLRGRALFNATAQQWPVFLHDGEVAPQVQDGDQAYLATDALPATVRWAAEHKPPKDG